VQQIIAEKQKDWIFFCPSVVLGKGKARFGFEEEGGDRGLLTARRKEEENKSIWRISSVRRWEEEGREQGSRRKGYLDDS
jgi:hypothetical protein